jgi:hypothetical protein
LQKSQWHTGIPSNLPSIQTCIEYIYIYMCTGMHNFERGGEFDFETDSQSLHCTQQVHF